MNIKIEGNRCKTTSPYDVRMIRAVAKLEGRKIWVNAETFSFENTPYNIEVWRQTFPDASVDDVMPQRSAAVAADKVFEAVITRPTFQYKTPPRSHQKAALQKMEGKDVFALFMDMGTGKTWTGLTLAGQRWCAGQSDNLLIIARNGVHEQWAKEELAKNMSDVVRYKAWVFGKSKRHMADFEQLLKFDGLKIFCINIDAVNTKAGQAAILAFMRTAKGRGTVYVDESQDIKEWSSERTRACIKIGALARYRLIMSGTPIGNNLLDLFSQFQFLDERIIGHRYLTTYKNRYCDFQQGDYGPVITGHKHAEELFKKIDPYSFRITTEECYDLPPQDFIQVPFALSTAQLKLMQELRDNFFAEVGTDQMLFVKNAASLLMRMQQISCGYIVDENGAVIQMNENPRLDALLGVLQQRTGKVIIWCRFQQDIETIKNALGDRALCYYGKTKKADRQKVKDAFIDHRSGIDYLVANPAVAGAGLDGFQASCWTNVYYSNSFSALDRWQSERRTWRDGTEHPVTYFDLVAQKSPDKKILANLCNKKDISDLTLDEYRILLAMEEDNEIV